MKNKKISFVILFAITIIAFAFTKFPFQNGNDPWAEKQLMTPADLAKILNDSKSKQPIILSIGFGGGIKGSIEMGAAKEKEGIKNLKKELTKLPKDADIVIYCGCCPFEHCPNIRPAFQLLNEMKFTNHKLLNLSHNLKTDWIDKGYPDK
ncbi:MAG: rhodanese-like domain-containing protein [Bacteroidetes bacterium]|nr:rhodanese-like domain-containing protein [Bacteroidota bacterium]